MSFENYLLLRRLLAITYSRTFSLRFENCLLWNKIYIIDRRHQSTNSINGHFCQCFLQTAKTNFYKKHLFNYLGNKIYIIDKRHQKSTNSINGHFWQCFFFANYENKLL